MKKIVEIHNKVNVSQNALANDITDVIEHRAEHYKLTDVDIIGVLELVKYEFIQRFREG